MKSGIMTPRECIVLVSIWVACLQQLKSIAGQSNATWPKAWGQEKSLQLKVSLQCESEPLDAVLGKLSTSAGVNLKLAGNMQQGGLKITAFINGLPLGKVMDGLAELFSGAWAIEDNAYVLHSSIRKGIDQDLLRLGDPGWFDYIFGWAEYEQRKQLALEIYEALTDEQRARAAHEGIIFASLPTALQNRLTEIARGIDLWDKLVRLRKAMPDILGRAIFHVRIPQKPEPGVGYVPEINITLTGNVIARIPWIVHAAPLRLNK